MQGAFSRGGAGLDADSRSREFQALDHLSFSRGRHGFKTGVQVDAAFLNGYDRANAPGTFTFSSLADYLAGRPQLYTRRDGAGSLSFNQFLFAAYAQDEIRLRKNLSLSLGVRYETQTHISGHVNFAPRAGIAWSPFKNGRTTIRAGGGIYQQWLAASVYGQVLRVDGARQSDIVVPNPAWPDPFAAGARTVPLPASVYRFASYLRMPYVVRTSVGVQQQIGKYFSLMSDVRWQRGVDLLYSHNLNAPLPGATGRPDPRAGNVMEVDSGAWSQMRGLMVNLMPAPAAAMGRRAFWFVNYLYGINRNEIDSPLAPVANSYDRRADRGPSSTDARHRFNAMVNLSLGRGFQSGSIFRASSALPYNVTTGFDTNGDTLLNDRPAGLGRNSARGSAQYDLGTRLSWLKGIGRRSDLGDPVRQMIRIGEGAGIPDMPMGAKPGDPRPRARLQFYAQAFNLLNYANLTGFVGVRTSPLFGRATAAQAGRRLEVGVKVSF